MSENFETLVEKYHPLVMSLIRRYYGGQLGESAEDLGQEVWARLWESFKKNERNIVSFKSYLYRTVQTTMWEAIRSLEKERRTTAHTEQDLLPAPEDALQHQRFVLEAYLKTLKPNESRIIRAHLKGFNTDEIGALMGCSEGRIRNLLSRTKKKLMLLGGSEDAPIPE